MRQAHAIPAVDEAQAERIADRADELAEEFIAHGRSELAAMSFGDARLLFRAAQLVRSRVPPGARRPASNPEHVAFSLLIAANQLLRRPAAVAGEESHDT